MRPGLVSEAQVGGAQHGDATRPREAYEAVPKHNRRYVGDMDTEDFDVRMIIYGEQELESRSHRSSGGHD